MKKVYLIADAVEGVIFTADQTVADADKVVLLDEIKVNEKTFGLYYWPWKNEYVTWVTYDHENIPAHDGKPAMRGMNHGCYFSANTSTKDGGQRSGLSYAMINLYRRARDYGWKPKPGSIGRR